MISRASCCEKVTVKREFKARNGICHERFWDSSKTYLQQLRNGRDYARKHEAPEVEFVLQSSNSL